MAQKRERIRKKREAAKTEEEPKAAKCRSKTNKKGELIKWADDLLKTLDALLAEYARDSRSKDSRPNKVSPRVHLCDGTKIDLRKLMR